MPDARPLLPRAKFELSVGATGLDPASVKINGYALAPLTSIDLRTAAGKQTVLTRGLVAGQVAVVGEGVIAIIDHYQLLNELIDFCWTATMLTNPRRLEALRARIEDAGLAPTVLS